MRQTHYLIIVIITTVMALLTTTSSLAGNSAVTSSKKNNQPLLNNDVRAIYDIRKIDSYFGFASDIISASGNSHQITLAGSNHPHTIQCTNQTPLFTVFVANGKDKKLYWKFAVNKTEYWLTDSNKQRIALSEFPIPLFRTDADNRWMVSLDKGKSYTLLRHASGKPIVQQGKHPGLFKECSVTQTEISFTLVNNKKFQIARTPNQRGALETLYNALNGRNWARQRNWKSTSDIGTWQGITCDAEGYVTKINLRRNCLTGTLPEVFAAFPRCKKILLNNGSIESDTENFLTGPLPQSMLTYIETTLFDLRYCNFKTSTFAVPEERIDVCTQQFRVYPQNMENNRDFRIFIDSDVDGTGEIHKHLSCYQYQKATEGKGIDLYFVGDGFDAAHHTVGGTVDYWYKKAAEATFAVEPMNKLRKYYNVFFIYAHSKERGVGLFDITHNTMYRYWQKDPRRASAAQIRSQNIATAIEKATGGRPLVMTPENRTCVSMIFNSTNNGLFAGMMYSRRPMYKGVKTPIAIALNPARDGGGFARLLQHEFVGHAIGGIHDEYGTEKSKKHPNPTTVKWGPNLDTIADPTKCKWSKFYNDPRYAHEKIGCYPGGRNYSNVYRPTYKSIINGGRRRTGEFNAPSRAGIYQRTMQRAFDNWTFDYEEFVKFDLTPVDSLKK